MLRVSESGELNCVVTSAVWNVNGGDTFGFGSLCLPDLNVLAGGSCQLWSGRSQQGKQLALVIAGAGSGQLNLVCFNWPSVVPLNQGDQGE